jgi:hypothetical protein
MRKRWVIVRCWAGQSSVMIPSPTGLRFWSRRRADRIAAAMSRAIAHRGMWCEVRPIAHIDGDDRG